MKKENFLWVIMSLAFYGISYWLCRYVFDFHGMSQFPLILFFPGLIVLLISLILRTRFLTIMTVSGYIGGFFLGMLFNTDGLDEGGATTNNLWKIWAVSFLISIGIGIVADIIKKIQNKKNIKV